jgi:hypothetical protein
MALIERITLHSSDQIHSTLENSLPNGMPGLRIAVRATTSSLSDYPEWSLDQYGLQPYESVVSDGACS